MHYRVKQNGDAHQFPLWSEFYTMFVNIFFLCAVFGFNGFGHYYYHHVASAHATIIENLNTQFRSQFSVIEF